jgi:hypothetical protein
MPRIIVPRNFWLNHGQLTDLDTMISGILSNRPRTNRAANVLRVTSSPPACGSQCTGRVLPYRSEQVGSWIKNPARPLALRIVEEILPA